MNLKINENYGNIEAHIEANKIKYISMLFIFFIGVIIGGMCFCSLKTNGEGLTAIKELIEKVTSSIVNERWLIINEYFFKDLKRIFLLTIISSSMIGLPLLLILILYYGLTCSFTIASLIYTFGILKGNIFAILLLFVPNLFLLVATMIVTNSSIKMLNNFLKMKKSLKIETIRHLIVCLFSMGIIIIGFLIRAFGMNFVEKILNL